MASATPRGSFCSANEFHRATIQKTAVAGDMVTIADAVVDAALRVERRTQTIRADGKDNPTDRAGYPVLVRWRDERTLEPSARKTGRLSVAGRTS
jgi:glutathione S-transferase